MAIIMDYLVANCLATFLRRLRARRIRDFLALPIAEHHQSAADAP
jgi:hypothetical protein